MVVYGCLDRYSVNGNTVNLDGANNGVGRERKREKSLTHLLRNAKLPNNFIKKFVCTQTIIINTVHVLYMYIQAVAGIIIFNYTL